MHCQKQHDYVKRPGNTVIQVASLMCLTSVSLLKMASSVGIFLDAEQESDSFKGKRKRVMHFYSALLIYYFIISPGNYRHCEYLRVFFLPWVSPIRLHSAYPDPLIDGAY